MACKGKEKTAYNGAEREVDDKAGNMCPEVQF